MFLLIALRAGFKEQNIRTLVRNLDNVGITDKLEILMVAGGDW